jgi:hypothetical protein
VSLKRKSKKRVAIPFKKQRSKEKKNKGAKKKKNRERVISILQTKEIELQFDWCQLFPSIHFFYLDPFLSTFFFL